MSIESETQQDLALTDSDAEGITGGKRSKKAAPKAKKPAPTHAVVVHYSPGPTGGPTEIGGPAVEDCDGPGYGGAADPS